MRRLDAIGLAVAAVGFLWTFVTAIGEPGSRPWPTALAWMLAVAGIAAGRAVGRRMSARGASVVVASIAGVLAGALLGFDVASSGGPPLGYGNANGALFAQLVTASVLLRVSVPWMERRTRLATTITAAGAVVACVASGSAGAVVALTAGLLVTGGGKALGRPWFSIVLAPALLVAFLGVTAAMASGAGPVTPGDDSLGTRIQLWRSAVEMVQDEPLTGVGPGRFDVEDGVSSDPDLRRVHSTPLQLGAEQGAIGMAVALAAVAWVVARLWSVGLAPRSAVGAGVLVTTGLQASWDWVLAEPAILALAAAQLGWATAVAPRQRRLAATRA